MLVHAPAVTEAIIQLMASLLEREDSLSESP
jgi:hypothetical protein